MSDCSSVCPSDFLPVYVFICLSMPVHLSVHLSILCLYLSMLVFISICDLSICFWSVHMTNCPSLPTSSFDTRLHQQRDNRNDISSNFHLNRYYLSPLISPVSACCSEHRIARNETSITIADLAAGEDYNVRILSVSYLNQSSFTEPVLTLGLRLR